MRIANLIMAAFASFAAAGAVAQPYPPRGGTDASARIITQALGEQMGQQFIVDSRSGANGNIGLELAAKSAPNG